MGYYSLNIGNSDVNLKKWSRYIACRARLIMSIVICKMEGSEGTRNCPKCGKLNVSLEAVKTCPVCATRFSIEEVQFWHWKLGSPSLYRHLIPPTTEQKIESQALCDALYEITTSASSFQRFCSIKVCAFLEATAIFSRLAITRFLCMYEIYMHYIG